MSSCKLINCPSSEGTTPAEPKSKVKANRSYDMSSINQHTCQLIDSEAEMCQLDQLTELDRNDPCKNREP